MKIRHLIRILLLIALLTSTIASHADMLRGRVVRIADGDTVTVLDDNRTQHKIRLTGIDAPEKAQPFGDKSRQSISSLVFNKQVTVEYDKKDRYGRTLGKIIVDGIDANLEQVRLGMAWHYKHYQDEQTEEDRTLYSQAEDQARAEMRGLWSDPNPVPPWDWRRAHRRGN